MAFTAKSFSIFLLLITLLSSLRTQASKVPNVNPNTKQPPNNQQQEPKFLPENEHPYGLYSQDSGHIPHSTTTPNDNPAATPATNVVPYDPAPYVTEPAEERNSYTTNPNNNYYYNGAQNYYNSQQEEESSYQTYPANANNRKTNNYYYNAGRFRGGATLNSRDKYFNNGGGANNGYDQPQGMSDTRSLENGKYFYDINTDMYSSNHPYEMLRRIGARNEYNNMNNAYEFNGENSMGGYQNQDEFQDEVNNMP
ncbi:hypothetical protein BUALT_Bualt18G0112200 [Buddleja alternifolia]|uniref:Protein E6-like n=1 Tax=Buddleja alternifolia TaxID=168488 RepID=A0AAV6WDU9_9LAMI|nr:hypothetical protein BUALT_Bualt18G0112200 [Buddleja alternifolia]